MFCPQCGIQAEQQIKFCRSCGLKLSDHAQLLPSRREPETKQMSPEEAESEVRLLKGTKALAISSMFLPISMALTIIALGIDGRHYEDPLILLLFLSFISFGIGIRGFIKLIRAGFFKTFKKRLNRAEAVLLNQQDSPQNNNLDLPPETNRIPPPRSAVSITEHTTHELQPSAGNSGKVN